MAQRKRSHGQAVEFFLLAGMDRKHVGKHRDQWEQRKNDQRNKKYHQQDVRRLRDKALDPLFQRLSDCFLFRLSHAFPPFIYRFSAVSIRQGAPPLSAVLQFTKHPAD